MQVVINDGVPPPPPPPKTYDFLGLTEAEVRILRVGLGNTSPNTLARRGADPLAVPALHAALKSTGVVYTLHGNDR